MRKNDEKTIYIKGVGNVTSVGELDVEKLILRLLKSKYITGRKYKGK
ncbi:hypothetical protein ACSU64_05455 [Bacillaceae bacterium C204]